MRSIAPFSRIRRLALLASLFVLNACATPGFQAEVTRFHTLPTPAGETLLIEPLDDQEAGIEFGAYASLIGERLGALGYIPARGSGGNGGSGDGEPRIIAKIGYDVVEVAPLKKNGSGLRVGLGVGGGGRHVGGGLGTSFDLSGGPKPEYMRRLTLVMTDRETGQRLFEGHVESRGRTGDLALVMPSLVDAMFTGFPGQSGTTIRVKLNAPR